MDIKKIYEVHEEEGYFYLDLVEDYCGIGGIIYNKQGGVVSDEEITIRNLYIGKKSMEDEKNV